MENRGRGVMENRRRGVMENRRRGVMVCVRELWFVESKSLRLFL
jgi:hypothetical protein